MSKLQSDKMKSNWILRKANGYIQWNKGKKLPELSGVNNPKYSRITRSCKECKELFTVRNYRKDTARFCSQTCSHKNRNSGKYKADYAIRRYPIYQDWRTSIFERDNYTCVECDVRGGELHADHIKPFAIIIYENKLDTLEKMMECKELWDVSNGRTMCAPCHRKTDTYGRRSIYFNKESCIATA